MAEISTLPISIHFAHGHGWIWNAEDVLRLRSAHRVVGRLLGCPPRAPRQTAQNGLPLLLITEEVDLLVKRKVATVHVSPSLSGGERADSAAAPDGERADSAAPSDVRARAIRYREDNFRAQVKVFREERRKEILRMADTIVRGKKRKLLKAKQKRSKKRKMETESIEVVHISSSSDEEAEDKLDVNVERNAIIEEEMKKIVDITPQAALVQTFTEHPWLTADDRQAFDWTFPSTPMQRCRTQVFADLWQKGFFLTDGQKFGVDFMAYPGDPLLFHAQLMIVCAEATDKESSGSRAAPPLNGQSEASVDAGLPVANKCGAATDGSEFTLAALNRLATKVKKTVLLANLAEGSSGRIRYRAVRWSGSSAPPLPESERSGSSAPPLLGSSAPPPESERT